MERTIRAIYDDQAIRVYQAFNARIALPALAAGRFVHPFKRDRMTWIKPSFNWMMYRSGYCTKPDQEYVLAIDIIREGFDWALTNACLSRYDWTIHSSYQQWQHDLSTKPVRVQWDPERDQRLERIQGLSAIQIGLSGIAVHRYIDDWIIKISDETTLARRIAANADSADLDVPSKRERHYPAIGDLRHLGLHL